MKKITSVLVFALMLCISYTHAQEFLKPIDGYSRKKPAYFTMEDGQEMEVLLRNIKYKKGLMKEINYLDENGDKQNLPIDKIVKAYIPQTAFDKFAKITDMAYNAQEWKNMDNNMDRMNEGYALFEKTEVMVKKNKMTLLMQVLNPDNNEKLTVYHDPYASETGGVGVGGIQMTGGLAKSYYVQFDDGKPAIKFTKKDYRKEGEEVFKHCRSFIRKYEEMKWNDFQEAVYFYNDKCE